MTTRQNSSIAIVFILGLLAMLMPLSIDMYLPALPVISEQFGVPAGSAQMTLSTYILGFAVGQLLYGPMADSIGRKPVILGGTLVFAAAAVACALAQTIDQLIVMRFFHGLAAAAASVVINALMRDIYPKEEFSRMMSFVMLVTTIAPLLAPIVGGWVLVWLSWHYIFWILAVAAILASVMIFTLIKETLPVERRQPFRLRTTLGNFASLFRHKRVLSYMLASGFSFAGMFSFLSAGPFVYIEINHVSPQHFGYYFALNIVFLFVMTIINSRFVRRVGALNMFRTGLWIQFVMAGWMVFSALFGVGFWALIKETLPVERRQPFRLRTTLGNFASLFRHKRVLSYMLASGFSFAGMFSFLSAGPFVYIEINHVSPQHFGYYFALNIVFLFVMTIINSRFVRRVGALNMFRTGLWIQFVMAGWMVFSALFGVGFWALVVGVAAFVGCVSMVSSNAMAVILDEFPHMAGTASSLAGTFRFGIGAIVGALLSLATFNSAWPMIWSIAFCATCSILFYLYASRAKKR